MAPGNSLEDQARDPLTDQHELYRLAADHPELRPLIAGNPNTYPALLDWLADLGDPRIDAALAARESTDAESSLETDETEFLTPPVAPPLPPAYQPTGPGPVVTRNTVMPRERTTDVPLFAQPQPQPQRYAPPSPLEAALSQPNVAPPRKRNAGLIAAFAALGVLALVAAGIAVYTFLGVGGAPAAAPMSSPEASSAAPQQPTAPESATPTPTPTPEVKYPAPAGATALSSFASPSGNISCRLGDDSAECTIAQNNYQAAGYPDCGTNPVNLTIDKTGATLACSSAPAPAASDILGYSAAAAHGDFACTSSENGVNCWDTITGASFALARDGWTTSNTGPMSDQQFPWVK